MSKATAAMLLTVIALSYMPALADNKGSTDRSAPKTEAKVSQDEAGKIALKHVGGGTMFDAELEREHGKLFYSFDISNGDLIKEVHVDAITGKVLSVDTETVRHEKSEKTEAETAKSGRHEVGKTKQAGESGMNKPDSVHEHGQKPKSK